MNRAIFSLGTAMMGLFLSCCCSRIWMSGKRRKSGAAAAVYRRCREHGALSAEHAAARRRLHPEPEENAQGTRFLQRDQNRVGGQ